MNPVPQWRRALSNTRIDEWAGFALAASCVVLGAAAFEFFTTTSALAATPRAWGSLQYGIKLVLGALVFGIVVWSGLRAAKGSAGAPEMKETVLWSASLLVTLITALRMYQ